VVTDALVPAIGDLILISEDAGVHGHGEFWLRVLGAMDGLVLDRCYVRGYPVDDPTQLRTYYVQTSRLTIRRDEW
jgi:hypothetical protein